MKSLSTIIEGVNLIEIDLFQDLRGSFSRLFCENDFSSLLGTRKITQINRSLTVAPGTVRGMHFQYPPHAETKLISCNKGRVWDVAVDLRLGSSTFLRWHAEELSSHNRRMLIIPEGCAHGFQALDPDSELLYFHTNFYTPEAEGGVLYDDPQLDITWPLPITNLSNRDKEYPLISQYFNGIRI
jgi:dTDP-4-dehydrorhamnose 3,5-epimerase